MGVLVCYDDYTYDVINDYHLDYLLDKGCIAGYDTSENWKRLDHPDQDVLLLTEIVCDAPQDTSPS